MKATFFGLLAVLLLAAAPLFAQTNQTVQELKANAEKGDAQAQFTLSCCYASGQGVAKDEVEAMKWTRKAAEQNFPQAQFALGLFYENGKVLDTNYVEAVKWIRKAAEQGLAIAQFHMSLHYFVGEGVPQSFVEACKWDILASAQGNDDAVKHLSTLESLITSEQISKAQELASEFKPHKESDSGNSTSPENLTFSGTGFFITDDGYLISNYHVVKDAIKVRLVTSAGTVDAKVIQVDAANDLALLKADGKFSPLPIAASRSAHLGGTVATIGFPDPTLQGFSPKLAKGEIASLSGAGDDPRYFQISVPVQPGNSGGALVDEHGNVIGIVSAKLDASVALAASGALPENVNYAVKSSLLLSFLESVPEVSARLKTPNTADEKFSDVVKSAQDAAVLVLVY